jgi:hypothetical protein
MLVVFDGISPNPSGEQRQTTKLELPHMLLDKRHTPTHTQRRVL